MQCLDLSDVAEYLRMIHDSSSVPSAEHEQHSGCSLALWPRYYQQSKNTMNENRVRSRYISGMRCQIWQQYPR